MPSAVEVQPLDHHGIPWNQFLIFINRISDKGLVSGIHKEFLQLKSNNKKQLKMDNGIKTFLQGRYTMTKKYIKRCSTSLIIWGMEPKPQ